MSRGGASTRDSDRLELDPARRNGIARYRVGSGAFRVLLDRSSESAQRGEPTQDYLVVGHADSTLCFAVTDGVGSSFLGEVAARFLARVAVDWLLSLARLPSGDELRRQCGALLESVAPQAARLVDGVALPHDLPGVMIAALEQKRAYGSEAMLACGRVDWTRHGSARVGVAWLGDAQLRVMRADGRHQDLTGSTADRWSTKRGPRGRVQACVWNDGEVERVIACSDGLGSELDAVMRFGDRELDSRLRDLAGLPTSDDIALVDVAVVRDAMPAETSGGGRSGGLLGTPTSRQAEPTPVSHRDAQRDPGAHGVQDGPLLAAPAPPERDHGRPALALRWSPVPYAADYVVELAADPTFSEPIVYEVVEPHLDLPALPGIALARVRARDGDRTGPWSPVGTWHAGSPVPDDRTDLGGVLRIRPTVRTDFEVWWDEVPGARTYVLEVDDGDPHRPPYRVQVRRPPHCLRIEPGPLHRIRITAQPTAPSWERRLEVRIVERRRDG